MEFLNYFLKYSFTAADFLGGKEALLSYSKKEILLKEEILRVNTPEPDLSFFIGFDDKIFINPSMHFSSENNRIADVWHFNYCDSGPESKPFDPFGINNFNEREAFKKKWIEDGYIYNNNYEIFYDNFSRIFVGKPDLKKINQSSNKLLIDASNTAQILGQIFQDETKKEDFIEWLRILIPEFENIEVKKNEFDGSFHIFVKEKSHDKHFPATLLSDGTKNILALMAAVYQSNQPQFLCIEEPENGLHPHAIELLVDFFREKCETEGHHIWLNTHSPTLVRCLAIDEVITVNKINGETKAKQFKKEEAVNMKMDEAWLTNTLGGGVSWSK